MKTTVMAALLGAAIAIVPMASAEAGTSGCLLGAAAGGFGGAQFGKGNGKLAMVGLGVLLGCGTGSRIQDNDNRRYQQQPQQPQPVYRPQRQQYTGYMTPVYQQAVPVYVHPRQPVVQNECPYPREYQTTVTVGGREVPAYGPGCSYDGGQTWQLVGPLTPAR